MDVESIQREVDRLKEGHIPDGMSAFEAGRHLKILQNKLVMASIGLTAASCKLGPAKSTTAAKPKAKRPRHDDDDEEYVHERRVSRRIRRGDGDESDEGSDEESDV